MSLLPFCKNEILPKKYDILADIYLKYVMLRLFLSIFPPYKNTEDRKSPALDTDTNYPNKIYVVFNISWILYSLQIGITMLLKHRNAKTV